jgi:pilus assembly protein CpaE
VDGVARVVLGLEEHEVAEAVMQFLDRGGRARVVATASDDRQLSEAIRQLDPDVVVAQPKLAPAGSTGGVKLIALETRESIASLRAAMEAGAAGFFVWPAEREQLAQAAASSARTPLPASKRAKLIAVHSGIGGAGTTFVACHLAAAFARRGIDPVLLDADPVFDDLSSALGVPTEGLNTLADLISLGDELAARHVEGALWKHDSGCRLLPAPRVEVAARVQPSELMAVVDLAASISELVVIQLSRSLDEKSRAALAAADDLLEVIRPDAGCLRATARALELLQPHGLRPLLVVNRARGGDLSVREISRAFDAEVGAVVPEERAIERARSRGGLMPARGRIGRIFDRLAERLSQPS